MQINVSEHRSSKCRFNIECFNKSGVRIGCRRSRALIQVVVTQMSDSKGLSIKITHSTVQLELPFQYSNLLLSSIIEAPLSIGSF